MATVLELQTAESILTGKVKVTKEQRLKLMAKMMGYEEGLPPDVVTILEDDYYLGNWYNKNKLYPYWKEQLIELYPSPIETSAFVVVAKGAIGIGKSIGYALPIMLIDLIKLAHATGADKFFGLMDKEITPWTMRFFNVSLPKAEEIFIEPMRAILRDCPFFNDFRLRTNQNTPFDLSIHASSRSKHILSEALYGAVISEVNFFKPWEAKNIIDTALGRMTSRFEAGRLFFNHLVLDSSDTFDDSVVENFIKSGSYANQIKVSHSTIWDAKRHKGTYFNLGQFEVYLGDSNLQPCIIDDTLDRTKIDTDRILIVPKELYNEFSSDIIKSLQDKAGISVMSGSTFFTNREALENSFCLPCYTDDEYILDFFDDISLMDLVGLDNILRSVDIERPCFIRYDLGVSHDACGFGITQFDSYKERLVGGVLVRDFCFATPVAFKISRPMGQETPIAKLRDFVIELAQHVNIKFFTTDQYQSTQLRQEIKKSLENTEVTRLSVDLTDTAYVDVKLMMYDGLLKLTNSPALKLEMQNLIRVGNKVDHKPTSLNPAYTKDISDAVVGSIFTARSVGDEATVSDSATLNNYLQLLSRMTQVKRSKRV